MAGGFKRAAPLSAPGGVGGVCMPPVEALSHLAPFEAAHLRPAYGPSGPTIPHPNSAQSAQPFVPVGAQAPSDNAPVNDLGRYAHVIDINLAVPNAGNGVRAVEAPPGKRNFLGIRNTSAAANVFIGFGAPASNVSTFFLLPNQILFFDASTPQDDVYLLADAAAGFASVAYSNVPL